MQKSRLIPPLLICALLSGPLIFSANPAQAEKRKGPFSGFGSAFGLDEKTLNILNKGARVVKSLMPVKYREERAIGGAVALKVFAGFGGPYRDKPLTRYVSLVGNSLAAVSDRPGIPYFFAILNSPEPNAFAAPGGYVFVTIGLLKKLDSEAQLAGVLGHEIAHIVRRHSLKVIERGKRLRGTGQLTLAMLDKDPKLFADIIDTVTDIIFSRGLDHSLELEADRLGTMYAARLGYQPSGLKLFLDKLAALQADGEPSIFFKTHPSPRKRITYLQKKVLPAYAGHGKFKVVVERYKRYMDPSWTRK